MTESQITPVKSPMAGKIIQVLVKPGDAVKENQTIIVFESMKMEMEIVSPATGTVKEVKVAPGVVIEAEQLLLTIES
jgi:biotin carboxyl carrier protein